MEFETLATQGFIDLKKQNNAVSTPIYANTASVYGAFLKHLKAIAQKPLILSSSSYTLDESVHEVYNTDANVLIRDPFS